MNQVLIDQAKLIKAKYISGDISSAEYFKRLAAFGKKWGLSVFEIQKYI